MCIINCSGLPSSENPLDFPKVRFTFAKLVARDSQLTIHKPLCIMSKMMQELTEIEFKKTFGNGMTDITETEIDEPIDIWNYVKKLTENQIVNRIVYEKELVEKVYRNELKTFDHILLPTAKQNVFLTIVVDLENKRIFGHKILDLNKEYGIE